MQSIFCAYAEHVTAKGNGMHDRHLGFVLDFLKEVEDVSKKSYKDYYERHSTEIILWKNQRNALTDFMAYCGVQIGGVKRQARKEALEKRVALDKRAQEILDRFSAWLVKENAYSENTVRSYIFGIKDFLSYTTTLTTETAQRYKSSLEERKCAPKTINHRLNAVACLARFLCKHIEVKHIKVPRVLSLENVPTEKEVGKLLDYCKDHNEKAYIWVMLLSTTGARVHEFAKFTYEMVAAGQVDLKGKGNKVRRFFFSTNVRRECAEYAERNSLSGLIAVNRYGEAASTRGIAQLLHSMAEKAAVPTEKCHPHAFRHYFAKMYLKRSKTKDVTELADLLGHSGLDTTMIYIKRSQEEQRKMFNKNVDW